MILKFAHGMTKETETWEVFGDFDRYRFCEHFPANDIPREFDFTEDANQNRRWDISLFKGDKKKADIVVHSPIFILNEDGRTVDKI